MKWLAATLSDDRLCGIVEADLRQFYGADLRDFYRRGSGMTYRWLASHIKLLPEESRWVKHHRQKDGLIWDQADHHRQDVVDLLLALTYYTRVGSLSGVTRSDQQKIDQNAPKRRLRPGEEEPKPQMTPKEDLEVFFSN